MEKTEANKLRSEKIIRFLREHQLISILGLEKKINIPINTISNAILCEREIPSKHHTKIINELRVYGYVNKHKV